MSVGVTKLYSALLCGNRHQFPWSMPITKIGEEKKKKKKKTTKEKKEKKMYELSKRNKKGIVQGIVERS